MPIENLEEEGLEKNPKLILAQWRFLLSQPDYADNKDIFTKLMDAIKADDMAPFYEECGQHLHWTLDQDLLDKMKTKNSEKLKELDDAIEDAEKNLGEMEVREANLKKAEYLCRIGDKLDLEDIFEVFEEVLSDDEEVIQIIERPRAPRVFRAGTRHFHIWNETEFLNRFRLTKQTVITLFQQIGARIKHATKRNHAVESLSQLLIALRFYASGSMFITMGDFGGIHKATVSRTLLRVTYVIASLAPQQIKLPTEENDMSENALSAFRKTYDKTVSLGHRLDIVFHIIRIGLFYLDHDLITRNIEKAQSLIEEGGDWDRRNRLKVYEGTYCMIIRDFKGASTFFLDTISTFTSYELMDYNTFVRYTVYICMISLRRNELRDKIIKGSEILEVLHSNQDVKDYLFSLYNCHYADFFRNLAHVEGLLKHDYFLFPHYRYYVREMRIMAYSQLLESYQSLTLQYMAEAFGVTVDYIDQELSRFISAGRLHCKVDKVGGVVETNRPDCKNWQYQATIKQGDILLNRVQKLSRVINI